MSKEIAKKDKAELAEAADMSSWGASPMSSKDIVIPRIILMQPGTPLVTEGNAAFGEFRDSLSNKKLGDMKKGFHIIPICMKKFWKEVELPNGAGKPKYLRKIPVTPENENLPGEFEEQRDGGAYAKCRRDYVLEFYVLRPEEVDEGGELPYILSFTRTGTRAGKKLATQMYVTNRGAGLPPPGRTVLIEARKESNDDGTWAQPELVLDDENTKLTEASHMVRALHWFKVINQGDAKAHVEDEDAATPSAPQEPKAASKPKNHAPQSAEEALSPEDF